MRARVVAALLGVVVATACAEEAGPPVVEASEVSEKPSASASPTVDPTEARLAELRATDQFDEFAEHERAAKADGARLAWENFAPIVDGQRVEWTNKAELWDSIAPRIRDEALLLGPEYREPLWDNASAVPTSVDVQWTNEVTSGRGHYVEFVAAFTAAGGPSERVWGFLISTGAVGRVAHAMPPVDLIEAEFPDLQASRDWLAEHAWAWVQSRSPQ